ncbi:putative mitochondrial chaperone protein DNAj [Leptomonas pyrrhocoris]|uniref:Putative mitochondrial chaperone protein DNAj n=1 Tax=Leptomonas pyrrhocoris TaxID=157538 RepID=A0A0M9FTF6_LEPPY|nr:putative mitochondrial chaperone protein DNAj [Leptomonas pyrrhocoris]KPA75589.1 putative mitochondrial chaperone protein DNAj [Leptomonas pyrrhocoris]|eukprot:XP_015654028.1 putative mitochondrial chaperone protein DNAj [Leptomonas pyrrhocoris]
MKSSSHQLMMLRRAVSAAMLRAPLANSATHTNAVNVPSSALGGPAATAALHGHRRWQSSGGGPSKDLYTVLGVARNATPEQIKSAYKKRAKALHPDVNPSPTAAEDFAEAKQAYETLSDPQKRSMYDMTGNANAGAGGPGGFNPFGGGANPFAAGGNPFANMAGQGGQGGFSFNDFEEIFQKMSGSGKDKTRKPQGPEPGADIHYKLTLSFLEAVNGCQKEISYNTMRRCGACTGSGFQDTGSRTKCPHCGGRGKKVMSTGFFHMQQDCTHCGGTGELGRTTCTQCSGKGIVKDRSVQTLPVPKGVDNKERLKVTGKGEAGVRNGPPGNLYIEISVEEHPVFHREGSDIHVITPVTLSTAVLGGTVRVPTLTGEVETRVPVGTQQGDKLVLRGRGVHRPNQNKTGDFYIHFAVMLPKELTEEQKKAIADFAKDEKPLNLNDTQLQELKGRYRSWFSP